MNSDDRWENHWATDMKCLNKDIQLTVSTVPKLQKI